MTVGQVLSRARKKLGKKQNEIVALLAKRGVQKTQPTIHEWESDKSLPRTDEVRDVAAVYQVNPEQILPRKRRAKTPGV